MPPESRQFEYATKLYNAMAGEAKDEIYEGKVVETYQNIGISMAHYTSLFSALKELGCIELIDRGVRGRPTRYRLHGTPDREAFENLYARVLTKPVTPATLLLTELEQRISNLERRLKGIDIKKVIVNHEERIKAIEVKKGGSTD